MTKKQVRKRINRMIADANKNLAIAIENVLHEADMWYRDGSEFILNPKNHDDRNGDLFANDGCLVTKDVNRWLHTRKEVSELPKSR